MKNYAISENEFTNTNLQTVTNQDIPGSVTENEIKNKEFTPNILSLDDLKDDNSEKSIKSF